MSGIENEDIKLHHVNQLMLYRQMATEIGGRIELLVRQPTYDDPEPSQNKLHRECGELNRLIGDYERIQVGGFDDKTKIISQITNLDEKILNHKLIRKYNPTGLNYAIERALDFVMNNKRVVLGLCMIIAGIACASTGVGAAIGMPSIAMGLGMLSGTGGFLMYTRLLSKDKDKPFFDKTTSVTQEGMPGRKAQVMTNCRDFKAKTQEALDPPATNAQSPKRN